MPKHIPVTDFMKSTEVEKRPATLPVGVQPQEENEPVVSPDAGPAPEVKPEASRIISPPTASFQDLTPSKPVSDFELNLFEAHQEKTAPSLLQGAGAAVDVDSTTADLVELWRGSEDHVPNPDFRFSQDFWKEMTEGIPEQFQDVFEGAVSEAHARTLRKKTLGLLESERILATFGFGGVGLRILASILDPLAIGVALATDGAAAPFIYGAKVGRLAAVLRGGLTAAGTNAGLEAFLLANNPTKDARDLVFAATGGLVLGSGITAVLRGRGGVRGYRREQEIDAVDRMNKAVLVEDIEFLGAKLSAKGRAQLTPEKAVELDEALAALQTRLAADRAADSTAGAAQVDHIADIKDVKSNVDELLSSTVDTATSADARARMDFAAVIGSSQNPVIRARGGRLMEDALGAKEDVAKGVKKGEKPLNTADLDKTILYKKRAFSAQSIYQPAMRKWGEDQGFNWFQRLDPKNRLKFGEAIADAIDDPKRGTNGLHHPEAVRVANRYTELGSDIVDDLAEAGIPGFANLDKAARATYMTRVWRYDRFAEYNSTFGTANVEAALKGAILRASTDMSDELAAKIAAGLNDRLRDVHLGREAGLGRVFGQDSVDDLMEVLLDEGLITKVDADRVIANLEVKPRKDAGNDPRGKFRVRLDPNFELETPKGVLRIKDMMHRDAEQNFDMYLNQTSGMIAMSRNLDIRTEADYLSMVDDMRAASVDVRPTGRAAGKAFDKRMKKELEIIDITYNMIRGRPSPLLTNPGGDAQRLWTLMQIGNFIRVMGSVGWAQLPEIANTVSQTGFRAAMQHTPALKEVFQLSRNMKMDGDLSTLQELAMLGGNGHDVLLHQASIRFDPEDGIVSASDLLGKATVLAGIARRGVTIASGLGPITDISSRIAAQLTAQNLTDLAFKSGRRLSAIRIRKMGLDEDMANRVYDQIRKHAVVDDTETWGSFKLRRINLQGWEDKGARDAFVTATVRQTRNLIQQNDIGNLNKFMTGRLGQTLLQFRTFSIVAYPKQLLNGLHNNDMRTYMAFTTSMMVGSSAYVAQTYLNSFGKPNRRRWLRDRLDPVEIAKAGFQRSAFSTLIPGTWDMVADTLLGMDPTFTSRTTGLASSLITGSPSMRLVTSDLPNALRGVSRAMFRDGSQFSRQDFRAIKSLMPFHTLMGIRNIADLLGSQLPARSSR